MKFDILKKKKKTRTRILFIPPFFLFLSFSESLEIYRNFSLFISPLRYLLTSRINMENRVRV